MFLGSVPAMALDGSSDTDAGVAENTVSTRGYSDIFTIQSVEKVGFNDDGLAATSSSLKMGLGMKIPEGTPSGTSFTLSITDPHIYWMRLTDFDVKNASGVTVGTMLLADNDF